MRKARGHHGADYSYPAVVQPADSVKQYLAQQRLEADRLRAEGFGSRLTVADNTTPEGSALNRRVVFKQIEWLADAARPHQASERRM